MKQAEAVVFVPKKVLVDVYEYDQLSDRAKQRAYDDWSERDHYGWHDENRKVLDHIKETAGVAVHDWEYSTYTHHYHLDAADSVTYYNYSRDYDNHQDYSDITGLRAVKLAMELYYLLTETTVAYVQKQGKRTWYRDFAPRDWKGSLENSPLLKWRRSRLAGRDTCFTGYIASDVFSTALWDSIKKGAASDSLSLKDYIEDAFDELFKHFEEDFEASTSQEYFAAEEAQEYYYLEDGQEHDRIEDTETTGE